MIDIFFKPDRFVDFLPYMGKGMLAIFVVIGVIVLATLITNKLFSGKND